MTPFINLYVELPDNTRVDRTNVQYSQEQPDRRWIQQGDFLVNTETGERKINALPLEKIYPEFDIISGLVGGLNMRGAIKLPLKTKPRKIVKTAQQDVANITDLQWDDAYMAAVNAGDLKEAQRLRDLHFMAKAPDTKFVKKGMPEHNYHGGQKGIVSFLNAKENPSYKYTKHQGYRNPETRSGIYFSNSKQSASNYARLYKGDGEIYDVYINGSAPYTQSYATTIRNRLRNFNLFSSKRRFDPAVIRDKDLKTTLRGYDSVKHTGVENVALTGNQVKLADAITYDDFGNIIPLSKRDNFNINDIRYGLVPFIGAGFMGEKLK